MVFAYSVLKIMMQILAKMLRSLVVRKMQVITIMRYYFSPTRMARIKISKQKVNCQLEDKSEEIKQNRGQKGSVMENDESLAVWRISREMGP